MVRKRNGSEEVYEVERIVEHRVILAGIEYRVRWCGYPEECNDSIHYTKTDCPEAVKKYWQWKKKEVQASPPKKRSHDETCEAEGTSKSVSSQEPKRKAIEAQGKSEELENKGAEHIAEQIEADEEDDDLERDDRS
ncbi:unnamed protein product [Heligmosomoides polygyrus]|uniref:Chromo domain-containing protein n=1 Tax=Heligmosomoides polygyrus TaxID=6339 RepID=A0A183FGF8_HELPZ|nr:unnamed protein product [Heligmosomoides polygyrus]